MGVYDYEAISGFCVENAYATSANGVVYELLDPSDMGTGYLEAAYILYQYELGNISAQAGQLAVWEVAMDTGDDLTTGLLYATFSNSYVTEANNFLSSMDTIGFDDSGYRIAHSPVDSQAGVDPQDYVIHVPDASIMLLLGPAFLFLGMLGRRRKKV